MATRRSAVERRAAASRAGQGGVTLVELMIALAIGLTVVLAASVAFLAATRLFDATADLQQAQDTMRFARYVVQNVARQAGYTDYAPDRPLDGVGVIASRTAPADASADLASLAVFGATDTTVSGVGSSAGANGSDLKGRNDSLRLRFFGHSAFDRDEADTSMIDCLGQPVAGALPDATETAARAWSFFYVARAADGEPELYCKRRIRRTDADDHFQSQPIARGVERFKVVFGQDADGDSVPDRWIDAQTLENEAGAAGVASATEWRKVVALRVGMVVRSARGHGDLRHTGVQAATLTPLGPAFAGSASFDAPDDGRLRLTSTFTLMLRNVMKASP